MKLYKFMTIWAILSVIVLASCDDDDDDKIPGNPVLSSLESPSSALFGDSIPFSAHVSDNQVALSTLKVYLYYGEEVVSEAVIRTKENGTYSGKLFAPYYANIPNGSATLKFVLQNIHLTIKTEEKDVPLSRPDFTYLTLQTEDGDEYRMDRISLYNYTVTENFPQKVKAVIIAPKMSTEGSEITFGWENGNIKENAEELIPFSNDQAGTYSITFNTLTYEAAPFISLSFGGKDMNIAGDDLYQVDIDLEQGQEIEVTGISNLDDWWIDPDFFELNENGQLVFQPISGKYRIIADFNLEYFRVEAMSGNDLATLQEDGSGAIWIIGDNVGKPSLDNATGWTTEKGLLMAPIGDKKYRISFVAGENISIEKINFKFFHQRDWGGEFTHETLTTNSNIVFIGDGTGEDDDPLKRDPGNLGLVDGNPLTAGKTYVFTIEASAGSSAAVLTVEEK